MPFKEENAEHGLAKVTDLRAGRINLDSNDNIEESLQIPFASTPEATWVYYECILGSMLDSGLVIHNRLPQVNRGTNYFDSLSSVQLEDPNMDRMTGFGVNLKCLDQYKDIVQRMGHARYWFLLRGQALRVGHQVPIPGIKTIGGVPAIPYDRNPQWAYNRIAPGGNFSGAILWHAQWSLWYTTAVPPKSNDIPAVDPAAHISGKASIPNGYQSPHSQADDDAKTAFVAELVGRVPNQPPGRVPNR